MTEEKKTAENTKDATPKPGVSANTGSNQSTKSLAQGEVAINDPDGVNAKVVKPAAGQPFKDGQSPSVGGSPNIETNASNSPPEGAAASPGGTGTSESDTSGLDKKSESGIPAAPAPDTARNIGGSEAVEPTADLTADEEKQLEKILDGDEDDDGNDSDNAPDDFAGVRNKIRHLMLNIPETSPDSHTLWGAAGIVLTLGDLRILAKYMK